MKQEDPGDHAVATKPKPIKIQTTQELAKLYGLNIKTFKAWLEPHQHLIGEKVGRYFTVKQVMLIFEQFGEPESFQIILLPLFLPLHGILPLRDILPLHGMLSLHETSGYFPFCVIHGIA